MTREAIPPKNDNQSNSKMELSMTDNGKETSDKEQASKYGPMEQNIKVNGLTTRPKEKENSPT
jgi:hypothetical protein